MTIKCHHTVTVITLVLLSVITVSYCGVQFTSIAINVKTTVELL